MNFEKTIPISWEEGWDAQDTLCLSFYGVEFTNDFGVFKKGEKYKSISVSYGEGFVEAYNEEGTEVVKFQSFKSVPTEEE